MTRQEKLEEGNCYLVVGVGWNCCFTLHTDETDVVSVKVLWGQETSSDTYRVFYYLHSHWLCSTKGSSMSSCFMKEVLISCTQIRKKEIMANCRHPLTVFINHLLFYTNAGGDLVRVCAYTSMVSVCVSEGTHSRASSAQQPPHRLTDTQDGTKRWCVSPGNSRQTSTRVSRGSQPLRE